MCGGKKEKKKIELCVTEFEEDKMKQKKIINVESKASGTLTKSDKSLWTISKQTKELKKMKRKIKINKMGNVCTGIVLPLNSHVSSIRYFNSK